MRILELIDKSESNLNHIIYQSNKLENEIFKLILFVISNSICFW